MNQFSRFDPEGVGFNLEKGKFPTNLVQLGPARNRFSLGLRPHVRDHLGRETVFNSIDSLGLTQLNEIQYCRFV